ncbi:MAG TPA: hypothetical protein VHI52_21840 [Verrucomicrobiae bacterium]|nr:hypothetical protein [Verrucomicrobiae bacterium]
MTWVIQSDDAKRLVFVKAAGALESFPLRQLTQELRDAVVQHQSKGILLDYTQTISRLQPYEVFERPRVLQELGFPMHVRIAVVYAVLDENTQFLENVYRNKNYPVRVFADRSQALAWLEA